MLSVADIGARPTVGCAKFAPMARRRMRQAPQSPPMDGTAQRSRSAAARPRIDVEKLFDRLPPHAPEAEMSLLGSIILDPRAMVDVLDHVQSGDDFYSAAHGVIFDALREIADRNPETDLVELTDRLRDRAELEDVGGSEYLLQLAEQVPSAVNAPHYARLVADKARLRRLIKATSEILYDAYHVGGGDGPEDVKEAVDAAEMKIFEIARADDRAAFANLATLLQEELDRIESVEGRLVSGLHTGFDDLDEKLSGLQQGEMIIVAARPSMGKTALALNLAEQVAMGGRTPWTRAHVGPVPVGFFSLEMSRSALAQRLLSAYSGVDSHKMRTGQINDQVMDQLVRACGDLSQAPIIVDDTPNMTVMQLRARARRMVDRHGVKAIFVDYLQLMTAPGASRESRQVEVSAISRGIKALARELSLPVICLAQLNRGSESREGNRPRMSDLRESGSIEQDADVVMLLHRESYYHQGDMNWMEENEDKVNDAELIIAKQRNGPTGVVHLTWDAHTTRFKNRARTGGGFDPGYYDAGPAPAPHVASTSGYGAGPSAGAHHAPAPRELKEPSAPPFDERGFDDDLDGLP
jgi:replicative DNA helicase